MFGLGMPELIIVLVVTVFLWLSVKAFKFVFRQKKTITEKTDLKAKEDINVDSDYEFINDTLTKEEDVITATEEIPLDNLHGSEKIISEHEISKTVHHTIRVIKTNDFSGRFKASAWTLLESEIKKNISKAVGVNFGESITKTNKITISAPPGKSVKYIIEWRQKLRKGNVIYKINGQSIAIPYESCYGLSHLIKCVEWTELQ